MKTIAKIKYLVLSGISKVETWYKNLTNVSIMKFSIVVLGLLVIFLAFDTSFKNIELYKQERYRDNLKQEIVDLQQTNLEKDSIIVSQNEREQLVNDFVRELFSQRYYRTSLTGYHPTVEQCDSTPDITADGTKFDISKAGDYKYVALSRDLLTHFNRRGADIHFGDYILIKGTPNGAQDGIYQVRDTMNKRHTQWIDILLTPGEQSFYYRNILMYKIDNPEYVDILNEIYDFQESPQPLAMVEPEV